MTEKLKFLNVCGDPYRRGYQHGRAFADEIQCFLKDDLARINKIRKTPLSDKRAFEIAERYIPYIEKEVPALAQEIFGLSQGAKIRYREAALLQLRRELIASGLECTAFMGRDAVDQMFIAQNVDLPGNLEDLGLILKVETDRENEPDILMFTHIGLIGYLGINSCQIGVGLNMVLSDGWGEGVPPYLLIRHLLHQTSLHDCFQEIERIKRTSSRNLLLCDRNRFVNVEMTVQEERCIERKNYIIHSNHYLHEDFVQLDQLPENSSSILRMKRVEELLERHSTVSLPAIQHILRDHQNYPSSICAHGLGEIHRGETVASVVLYPEKGIILAAKGNPCVSDYEKYTL